MKTQRGTTRSPDTQLGLLRLNTSFSGSSMACWHGVSARLVSGDLGVEPADVLCNWLLSSDPARMSYNLRTIQVNRWRESSS